jgi:hypothetical protein
MMDDAEWLPNKAGSDGGGTIPGGTTHDGINRFSMHITGHSEGNDGKSTPHSSRLDLIAFLTEKR